MFGNIVTKLFGKVFLHAAFKIRIYIYIYSVNNLNSHKRGVKRKRGKEIRADLIEYQSLNNTMQ